jgi:hypothetical protein
MGRLLGFSFLLSFASLGALQSVRADEDIVVTGEKCVTALELYYGFFGRGARVGIHPG